MGESWFAEMKWLVIQLPLKAEPSASCQGGILVEGKLFFLIAALKKESVDSAQRNPLQRINPRAEKTWPVDRKHTHTHSFPA